MPFYGRSGTSWNNSATESYGQIASAYAAANGGTFPAANLDSVTINGTTWGYNGIDTVENKTQYAIQNGYGGVMIWELGQDYYASNGTYGTPSLLPAIKSVVGAAYETWTGSVSDSWSTPGNWNFDAVPGSTTNVVINGGAPTISAPFSITSLVLNGGTLTLAAGSGVFSTTSLTINPGATLDLGNNTFLINYGSGSDPISSIASSIISGFAGGSWTGTGIMSTAAQANAGSYGIGYADSADPGNPAGLASGQIKVMYTLLGDANLDGKVNGTDFNLMSANFNQAVTNGWDEGDFNYDGKVNGTDFNLMSANFNQAVNTSDDAVSASDSAQIVLVGQNAGDAQPADAHHHRPAQKK
jgi:hypothetical protein